MGDLPDENAVANFLMRMATPHAFSDARFIRLIHHLTGVPFAVLSAEDWQNPDTWRVTGEGWDQTTKNPGTGLLVLQEAHWDPAPPNAELPPLPQSKYSLRTLWSLAVEKINDGTSFPEVWRHCAGSFGKDQRHSISLRRADVVAACAKSFVADLSADLLETLLISGHQLTYPLAREKLHPYGMHAPASGKDVFILPPLLAPAHFTIVAAGLFHHLHEAYGGERLEELVVVLPVLWKWDQPTKILVTIAFDSKNFCVHGNIYIPDGFIPFAEQVHKFVNNILLPSLAVRQPPAVFQERRKKETRPPQPLQFARLNWRFGGCSKTISSLATYYIVVAEARHHGTACFCDLERVRP